MAGNACFYLCLWLRESYECVEPYTGLRLILGVNSSNAHCLVSYLRCAATPNSCGRVISHPMSIPQFDPNERPHPVQDAIAEHPGVEPDVTAETSAESKVLSAEYPSPEPLSQERSDGSSALSTQAPRFRLRWGREW